jgi:heme/copper-type cytochrome/quinol oxidase subunit 2
MRALLRKGKPAMATPTPALAVKVTGGLIALKVIVIVIIVAVIVLVVLMVRRRRARQRESD